MTTPPTPQTLDTADIQGLVVRGYGNLKAARFLVLEIVHVADALRYLREVCEDVNPASISPRHFARQIAFTASGLDQLGLPQSSRDTFSREFLEGMDDDVRADSLGDRGANDPKHWRWGRTCEDKAHVLVMLYASRRHLEDRVTDELVKLGTAFRVVHRHTFTLDDNKEHFGWRDGLSMPVFEGVPPKPGSTTAKEQETWTSPALRPGEFVLGYLNEYECYTESPTAELADDPEGRLPVTRDGKHKDLGKNGTYLVYREMTQDVHAMWSYLHNQSKEPGDTPEHKAIALGAKMVGRWPSGAPLLTSPTTDDPDRARDNEFIYAEDRAGLTCPVGAHIRRANPRDVLAADRDVPDSIVMVRKHQMIRRGRPFGKPVDAKLDPTKMMHAPADTEDRGLHFICLVGHISRQFEFVQRAWLHSANFGGLFKDGDPVSAARRLGGDNPNDEFTCQADPVRRKYKAMPQFTTLVGGAYFFLPGLKALRFIAHR